MMRRESMKRALEQSKSLNTASSLLVDLLFDYFQQNSHSNSPHGLIRVISFDDEHTNARGSSSQRGLSLPASAIGWLSCYLLPDEADLQYQRQWEDVQEEYCLPHASPPPQVQSRLSQLKALLQSEVTHLRVTNAPWPGSERLLKSKKGGKNGNKYENPRRRGRMLLNFDADSVTSFLRFYKTLQEHPRIDMKLFPELQSVSFHGIPAEWIQNLRIVSSTLSRLSIQRGRLRDSSRLFGIESEVDAIGADDSTRNNYDDSWSLNDTRMISPTGLELLEYEPNLLNPTRKFSSLKHLVLSNCGIEESCLVSNTNCVSGNSEDESMRRRCQLFDLLPGLVSIDLSHNVIVNPSDILRGMNGCSFLTGVDMSHNMIRSLEGSDIFVGIKVLLLSDNYIRNTRGLDRLYSLERLNLENNQLSSLCDVSNLATLPNLEQLSLLGNPMVLQEGKMKYRVQVLNLFKEARFRGNYTRLTFGDIVHELPTLDGKTVTKRELMILKYLSFGQRFKKDEASTKLDNKHFAGEQENSHLYSHYVTSSRKPINSGHIVRKAGRVSALICNVDSGNETKDNNLRKATGRTKTFASLETVIKYIGTSNANDSHVENVTDENHSYFSKGDECINNDDIADQSSASCATSSTSLHDGCQQSILESKPFQALENGSLSNDHEVKYEIINGNHEAKIVDASLCSDFSHRFCDEKESTFKRSVTPFDFEADTTRGTNAQNSQDTVNAIQREAHSSELAGDASHCDDLSNGFCNEKETTLKKSMVPFDFEVDTATKPIGTNAQNSQDSVSALQKEAYSLQLPVDNQHPFLKQESKVWSPSEEDLHGAIDFAAMERDDVYDGPSDYNQLSIADYYDLYFRSFIFPPLDMDESISVKDHKPSKHNIPRIQLYQSDRDLMMAFCIKKQVQDVSPFLQIDNIEHIISVTKENIIPCGIAATARITPKLTQVQNSKGSIIYAGSIPHTISEFKKFVFCISNKAIYLIPDFTEQSHNQRSFPSAIGTKSTFSSALWPHAYCRHPLKYLQKISFDGYGFQRLTLYFKLPSMRGAIYAEIETGNMSVYDYTYVICTYNQRDTIRLLQTLQEAAKDAKPGAKLEDSPISVVVENENVAMVKAIGYTLARLNFDDDILHYQILYQTWNVTSYQAAARRSLVLTNREVFLFHETYAGDLSGSSQQVDKHVDLSHGTIHLRTIASVEVDNISSIGISKDDAMIVAITFGTKSKFSWSQSCWYLKCLSLENAERLIHDVRSAASL